MEAHRIRRGATVVVAAVVVGCTGGGSSSDDQAAPEAEDEQRDRVSVAEACPEGTDGTGVWVHDQEPDDLLAEAFDVRAVAGWIRHGVHEGLYRRGADGQLAPQLLAGPPEETRDEDGQLRLAFELREDLAFSDGTPLTAEHVEDTFELLTAEDGDGARLLADPGRYELIDADSWELDGRRFAFSLQEDDASWPTWFARILPTHALPADVTEVAGALAELSVDGEPVPASGPFVATSWQHGERIEFTRNDRYHGAHPSRDAITNPGAACLAALELRFVDGADAVLAALGSGAADLAFVPPPDETADLAAGDLQLATAPDPATEVLLLNTGGPHLQDPRVRAALAAAVDRTELVERLYEPLLGDAVPAGGHGSALFGPDAGTDPTGEAGLGNGDQQLVDAALAEAGYARDGDGDYAHPERGPLNVALSTTGDDPLREREQQLLQSQLGELGWEVRIDNRIGAAHLDEQVLAPETLACGSAGQDGAEVELPGEGTVTADCNRFDAALVALQPSPHPTVAAERFRSRSGRDPTGLRSEAFDIVLSGCAEEPPGPDGRTACGDRLDATLVTRTAGTDGLVVVPLTVRPHLHLDGPRVRARPDASPAAEAGPLVDAAQLVVSDDAQR